MSVESLDQMAGTATMSDELPAISPRRRKRRPVGRWIAIAWLGLVCGLALAAPWLGLEDPGIIVGKRLTGPGFRFPEMLGTDEFGRSMLSRVIYGGRISLLVGVVSISMGLLIGGMVGVLAGHFRGRVDAVVSTITDASLAFPAMVFLLAITAVLGASIKNLVIALSVITIPGFVRLARSNALAVGSRDFVRAARSIGARPRTIVFREIVPNVIGPVSSFAFVYIAIIMIIEGSLSYIGLGMPPPTPSWGGMIASGKDRLETNPHLLFVPALVMFSTVLSIATIGEHFRRKSDSRNEVELL